MNFRITNGFQTGPRGPDGTTCIAKSQNLAIKGGILELTVPGGQSKGGDVTGAEIYFDTPLTGGVFAMQAQLDGTVGTDHSTVDFAKVKMANKQFTYHANGTDGDEQDIEMLGASLLEPAPHGTPPGIELTDWNVSDWNSSSV